jgi:4-oxalomesaconate tautomerase
MRGGTSKGAYFLASDLPADTAERDDLLLRIMGSPDPRQIDGIGGAHPLTSKVAVISPSAAGGADVDYLFLQVVVDSAVVTDRQNCGNILAGVGPFAVERGLVPGADASTSVRIRMVNTGDLVTATFPTPGGVPRYDGDTRIDGVPGTAAPVLLEFGSPSSGVFPTGSIRDAFGGVEVTCVDNGMPVVVAAASSFGLSGYESPAELEASEGLLSQITALRLEAGKAMGLGDVAAATVPKVSLVAPPRHGGTVSTRTFIPVRVHTSIGVLGGVSVGTAVVTPGAVGASLAQVAGSRLEIEHPSGSLAVEASLDTTVTPPRVLRSGVVRTARKLFDGMVFPRALSLSEARREAPDVQQNESRSGPARRPRADLSREADPRSYRDPRRGGVRGPRHLERGRPRRLRALGQRVRERDGRRIDGRRDPALLREPGEVVLPLGLRRHRQDLPAGPPPVRRRRPG